MDEKNLQRIDGIIKHINTVQKRLNGVSFSQFQESELMIDAVSFSIAQIGERMVKLEELLKDKYPYFPWVQARRMRNIIVHDYDHSDPNKVYETATSDLEELKQYCLKIKDDIKHISDNSFKTERLIIRPWDDMDADELYELAKEPEIGHWCGWEPHKTIKDSLFVLHNFLEVKETYAVCLKENGKVIGSIGLHFKDQTDMTEKEDECELGYWIGKPYWGNGYVTEACKEVMKHAFEDLNAHAIWCGYYDGNNRSKRVQQKLGFAYHHTCNDVFLRQLKETRIGHVSLLTLERYRNIYKN